MMGKSHIATGVCVGLLGLSFDASLQLQPTGQGMFLIAVAIGSLLPDIDHPQSIISRKIPLGSIVGRLVQHRGPFHSILGIVLLFGVLWIGRVAIASSLSISDDVVVLCWLGLLVGYVNHIVGDMLTVSGVKLFYPMKKSIGVPLIRTNTASEHLAVVIIVTVTLIAYYPSFSLLLSGKLNL